MASKIKVDTIENVAGSGNVSLGSGHNLVVPGNNTTSGNATVGGNLVVDTNTIYADSSSNKVGIGTSSPDTQLHISGNSSTRNSIVNFLTLDGGTAAGNPYDGFGTGITFQGRDYGNAIRDYAYIRGQITHTTSNSGGGDAGLGTALTFWTTPTGAGTNVPLERMRVDKDGHITMSNQPAFVARKNGNQTVGAATTQITGFTTILDVGSNWDNSQNRYTVPTAGIYLAGGFYQAAAVTGVHFGILKNGAAYGNDSFLDVTDSAANGYSVPFSMAANDYFTWIGYNSGSTTINANRSKIWVIKVA